MKPLAGTDAMFLRAAQGWMELGDHLEANEELDRITPFLRVHPDVLEVRWRIYAKAGKWEACLDIGKSLTQLAPGKAVSWIHHAYALHELKRTREAFALLADAALTFPHEPTIPYNLACYTCQLGDFIGAGDWLAQAYQIGDAKKLKLMALDDPDLAPLFDGEPD